MKAIKQTNIKSKKPNKINLYIVANVLLILLAFLLIAVIDEMYKRSLSISKFDRHLSKQNI